MSQERRQVNRMNKIAAFADFITGNWQTIALIYCIGAAITFVLVFAFFMWAARAETKEKELYPEYYEDGLNTASALMMSFIIALGCAVLWVGIPVLLLGVWFYSAIAERFPELMGDMADDDTENEERTEE